MFHSLKKSKDTCPEYLSPWCPLHLAQDNLKDGFISLRHYLCLTSASPPFAVTFNLFRVLVKDVYTKCVPHSLTCWAWRKNRSWIIPPGRPDISKSLISEHVLLHIAVWWGAGAGVFTGPRQGSFIKWLHLSNICFWGSNYHIFATVYCLGLVGFTLSARMDRKWHSWPRGYLRKWCVPSISPFPEFFALILTTQQLHLWKVVT